MTGEKKPSGAGEVAREGINPNYGIANGRLFYCDNFKLHKRFKSPQENQEGFVHEQYKRKKACTWCGGEPATPASGPERKGKIIN